MEGGRVVGREDKEVAKKTSTTDESRRQVEKVQLCLRAEVDEVVRKEVSTSVLKAVVEVSFAGAWLRSRHSGRGRGATGSALEEK